MQQKPQIDQCALLRADSYSWHEVKTPSWEPGMILSNNLDHSHSSGSIGHALTHVGVEQVAAYPCPPCAPGQPCCWLCQRQSSGCPWPRPWHGTPCPGSAQTGSPPSPGRSAGTPCSPALPRQPYPAHALHLSCLLHNANTAYTFQGGAAHMLTTGTLGFSEGQSSTTELMIYHSLCKTAQHALAFEHGNMRHYSESLYKIGQDATCWGCTWVWPNSWLAWSLAESR